MKQITKGDVVVDVPDFDEIEFTLLASDDMMKVRCLVAGDDYHLPGHSSFRKGGIHSDFSLQPMMREAYDNLTANINRWLET